MIVKKVRNPNKDRGRDREIDINIIYMYIMADWASLTYFQVYFLIKQAYTLDYKKKDDAYVCVCVQIDKYFLFSSLVCPRAETKLIILQLCFEG